MKKIPTLFLRDWNGNKDLVTHEIDPNCEWVLRNEGKPTRKFDGMAVLVKGGQLFKRYDRKRTKDGTWKAEPQGWIDCEMDERAGHWFGWTPVDEANPNDKYLVEAWNGLNEPLADGTYEFCGTHVQGNPEHLDGDKLIKHGCEVLDFTIQDSSNAYDEIRDFLRDSDIEGIVWHHDDGRMVKIKKIDFGIKR